MPLAMQRRMSEYLRQSKALKSTISREVFPEVSIFGNIRKALYFMHFGKRYESLSPPKFPLEINRLRDFLQRISVKTGIRIAGTKMQVQRS